MQFAGKSSSCFTFDFIPFGVILLFSHAVFVHLQDSVHKASNILMKDKKWLSSKTECSGRIEVEIHLSQAIKIAFVNIGKNTKIADVGRL